MYNNELERLILDFNKQRIAPPARYVGDILKEHADYPEYCEIIRANLMADAPVRLNEILHFLAFVIHESKKIPGNRGEELVDEIVEDDEIFERLEKLFLSDSYDAKRRVLQFYAAIGYDEFDAFLRKSFGDAVARDPLIVPEIIIAINRMKKEMPWDLIAQATQAPRFSIRWSFFGLFASINMDFENTYGYLDRFADDEHPLVRAESEFYRKYLDIINEDIIINPYLKEYNDGRILEISPEFTFHGLKSSFIDFLHRSGIRQYTVDLFEEFVDDAMKNRNIGIVNSFMERKNIKTPE